jgi:hypothetical protein
MEEQKSESIKALIESVKAECVVLPEFQRDFVWAVDKTYDLFDSLIKNIFIGAIIYGKPSFNITVRELDDRNRKGRKRKLKTIDFSKDEIEKKIKIENFRLILDGQQRVTSMYRALCGIDDVWVIIKNDDELKGNVNEVNLDNRNLEDILFEVTGQEDENRLSIKISDVFDIMNNTYRENALKEKFFDTLQYPESFDSSLQDELFTYYLICVNKLQDLLKAEKLLSYYLLDMSMDKFALFFERSNSRGIQLNFIDILAAKLYIGFNLREEIEKFEDEYPKFKPLKREIIVRAIAYLVSDGKDIDRTFILTKVDHNHFSKYWSELLECYKNALDYLYDNSFLISQSWIPYENMLISLILFLHQLGGKTSQISEYQKDFIFFWYWSAIFSLRYSGATNEVIIQDSNQLRRIAKGQKVSEKSFLTRICKYQVTNYEDILGFNRKSSAIYKGILNIVNFESQGLLGLQNTNKIPFNEKVDDHHIFPKSYVNKEYKEDENAKDLIDCVANKTLIPKLTNIKIGAKSPSKYLNELKEKDNPNIEESLKSHIINSDLMTGLYDEYYLDFVEERAKTIFQIIEEKVLNKKDSILKTYYDELPKKSLNLKIFSKYNGSQYEATFNPATQKILFKGKEYAVSTAASKVKELAKGRSDMNVNGWIFWKFIDKNGDEKYIDEYRKQ